MGLIRLEKDCVQRLIESSKTMVEAARKSGLHYLTFRRCAQEHGLWKPSHGMGIKIPHLQLPSDPDKRKLARKKIFDEILAGMHPQVKSNRVRGGLIEFGIKQNKCELCGIDSWCDRPIVCELDHINGICSDHRLENLRIICPNCHSQTPTFRGKNLKYRSGQ